LTARTAQSTTIFPQVAGSDAAAPALGAAIHSAQPAAAGRLAVLRSLQRGEINADEAAMLLDAAERAGG